MENEEEEEENVVYHSKLHESLEPRRIEARNNAVSRLEMMPINLLRNSEHESTEKDSENMTQFKQPILRQSCNC